MKTSKLKNHHWLLILILMISIFSLVLLSPWFLSHFWQKSQMKQEAEAKVETNPVSLPTEDKKTELESQTVYIPIPQESSESSQIINNYYQETTSFEESPSPTPQLTPSPLVSPVPTPIGVSPTPISSDFWSQFSLCEASPQDFITE